MPFSPPGPHYKKEKKSESLLWPLSGPGGRSKRVPRSSKPEQPRPEGAVHGAHDPREHAADALVLVLEAVVLRLEVPRLLEEGLGPRARGEVRALEAERQVLLERLLEVLAVLVALARGLRRAVLRRDLRLLERPQGVVLLRLVLGHRVRAERVVAEDGLAVLPYHRGGSGAERLGVLVHRPPLVRVVSVLARGRCVLVAPGVCDGALQRVAQARLVRVRDLELVAGGRSGGLGLGLGLLSVGVGLR